MSFKEILQKEKYVVVHGQSRKFRILKYSIVTPIFVGLYFWKDLEFTLFTLLISFIVSLVVHFFFHYKTKGWTKPWGLYKPLPLIKK